jgi:hypothetical protein
LDFEIFQLGKVNLSPTLRGTVDDPGDDALKIVGEGWRVSHDATLCFQHRADLLIASILIVPGDELRGAAGNSCDRIFPAGSFTSCQTLFILVTNVAKFENFKPGFERPTSSPAIRVRKFLKVLNALRITDTSRCRTGSEQIRLTSFRAS